MICRLRCASVLSMDMSAGAAGSRWAGRTSAGLWPRTCRLRGGQKSAIVLQIGVSRPRLQFAVQLTGAAA